MRKSKQTTMTTKEQSAYLLKLSRRRKSSIEVAALRRRPARTPLIQMSVPDLFEVDRLVRVSCEDSRVKGLTLKRLQAARYIFAAAWDTFQ